MSASLGAPNDAFYILSVKRFWEDVLVQNEITGLPSALRCGGPIPSSHGQTVIRDERCSAKNAVGSYVNLMTCAGSLLEERAPLGEQAGEVDLRCPDAVPEQAVKDLSSVGEGALGLDKFPQCGQLADSYS